MTKWLLIGLCLFLFIYESVELTCYECTDCRDPFNSSYAGVMDCSGTCAKTKRKDSGHVTRFCTPGFPETKCKSIDSAKWGDKIAVCTCNSDLCNTSSVKDSVVASICACVITFALIFTSI